MIKKYLVAFLISMVPLIELRGAVPFGLSNAMGSAFSGTQQIILLYIVAVLGNMLPVPFIFFFARKVLEWGKDKKVIGKFFTWCIVKGEKGGEKLRKTAGNRGIFWALLIFVGIPLPGTGAWTGTLAASFLKLDFKTSITAVSLGVILAGIIMSLGSKIVSTLGWFGVIGIIVVIAIIVLLSVLIKKKKSKE